MTLEDGKPKLMTLFRDPFFARDFRLAVHDLQWLLDTQVRNVSRSVEDARQHVKDVLDDYSIEASLETILNSWLHLSYF